MAAVARSLSAARSAAVGSYPSDASAHTIFASDLGASSRLLRHGVSREHVELSRGHLQSQKRRSPQTQRGGGRVEDVVLRLLDESGGERRRVRRRRLMPGASVRAQQLRRTARRRAQLRRRLRHPPRHPPRHPERRGVRADDVISGVDAQHPPRVHHREPILLRQVVDEATRRPDQRLHVPGRGSVSKSGERPVRLHQHLFVHAIGEARRRGGQRAIASSRSGVPSVASAQKTQSRFSGFMRDAHLGISRSTACTYAAGGGRSIFAHAHRHCERFNTLAMPPRFCAADCSSSASQRRAARIDRIARTPTTSWTSPVPRTNEGSPSSSHRRVPERGAGVVFEVRHAEKRVTQLLRARSRRGCAPPRRTARRA